MAVTLSGMSEIKHVVLIHGMGGRGDYWAPARAAFLECALVAGGAVRDRGGDQRLERVELGVGQQIIDHHAKPFVRNASICSAVTTSLIVPLSR